MRAVSASSIAVVVQCTLMRPAPGEPNSRRLRATRYPETVIEPFMFGAWIVQR